MRPYETVIIFDSTLDDSTREEKLDRFREILAGEGSADSVSATEWGKRTLAYPIEEHRHGMYVILRYQTEPSALSEFERVARIDESVIRHLTVVDPTESRVLEQAAAGEEA